jgi:hypothetical protein
MVELKRVIGGCHRYMVAIFLHNVSLFVFMYAWVLFIIRFICFFKRWIYVCSSGMSNVHTGIENTSQGGVSSVWDRTFGGPPWGPRGQVGGGGLGLMSGGLLYR